MGIRRTDLALDAVRTDTRVLGSAFTVSSTNAAGGVAGDFGISDISRVRIGDVVALATTATRTVALVQTADATLVQIDGRLAEIRRLTLVAGNDDQPIGNAELLEIQERIEKDIDAINLIIIAARFASRPLFNGSFRTNPFGFGTTGAVLIPLRDLSPDNLGRGVGNVSGFNSLTEIDVTTAQGADDSLLVVDAAVRDIAQTRTDLDAFETETIEAASRNIGVLARNPVGVLPGVGVGASGGANDIVLSEIGLRASDIAQSIAGDRTGVLVDVVG
jgi:flagellin